ncbi:MAG TPA: PDZ domain-containing protein [Steroidobacteraceae bacterium]|nr:PDZ domain-containing protein [Steroidobacteraceae bacterium]
MDSRPHGMQIRRRRWQVALLALPLSVLPAVDAAAQDNAAQRENERLLRELELERDQARAQREMDQRERNQREALRDQERIIQRQDDRLEQMRRRLDEASRDYAIAASELGRNFTYSIGGGNLVAGRPRALLGISVDTSERRDGALVSTVSPGGAAEEAGLRAGDLITSINGFDLTKEASPGRALVEKLQALQPDTRVKLAVLRDGRKMNYDVALRAAPPPPALPPVDDVLRRRIEERAPVQSFSTPLGGMEFATLSDRLGNYFGVKEGVLVVRAGPDSPYGLQDGDVILSIDARKPANAQHAGRILRSYQPGEKVKLRVQRDRKAIDLDSVAPGAGAAAGR